MKNQFKAILKKKLISLKRDKKFFTTGLVLPLIMVAGIVVFSFLIKPSTNRDYMKKRSLDASGVSVDLVVPFVNPPSNRNNSDSAGSRNETESSGLLGEVPNQRGKFPIFFEQKNTETIDHTLLFVNETGKTYVTGIIFEGINYTTNFYNITIMYNCSEEGILSATLSMMGSAILKKLTGKTFTVSQRNFPGSFTIPNNVTTPFLISTFRLLEHFLSNICRFMSTSFLFCCSTALCSWDPSLLSKSS